MLGSVVPAKSAGALLFLCFTLAVGAQTASPDDQQTPLLIDSFSPVDLVGVDLPNGASSLMPFGLAAKQDGTLLSAWGSFVFALDRRWQITGQPAKRLSDEGNYNFAHAIYLTPAETLYVRSADGTSLYAFPDGVAEYRRLPIEGQPGNAFGILQDGSPFVVDADGIRLYRGGSTARRLPSPAGATVLAAAAGPEDTIWIADVAAGDVKVIGADGILRRAIPTGLPPGKIVMRLHVRDDGSFLVVTNGDLRRYDAAGKPVWTWDGKDEGLSILFATYTDVAVTPDGLIYFNDFLGKRIFRLAERSLPLAADLARVARISQAQRRDGGKPELWLELADAYEGMGAAESAHAALKRYLDERPADAAVQDRRLGLQISLLKLKTLSSETDARELLARLGPESARSAYSRTMRSYENLLALSGNDEEIRRGMTSLRNAFRSAEQALDLAKPVPKILSTEIAALFPSLLQVYRVKPAGNVTIRNTLAAPIYNVRADLFIKKYMDYPAAGGEISRLEPGGDASLDLYAILNEAVLDVQEDLPLQALVRIHYSDGRTETDFEVARQVTLYKRTAISWDDTGKLAAFVTPNEETVGQASFSYLGGKEEDPLLSPVFHRALAICDSLGALPLTYVEDPLSPLSAVLGAMGAVDTIRFPRTTLAYKGGDCDDTTALLASLLEAAGIPTAILTSPGHVFLAFNSGEKEVDAWLFPAADLRTIRHGGKLWIPVETTLLSRGFYAAWKSASDLVKKHQGGASFEFIPVADLRTTYPPLPLPPSNQAAPHPDPARRAALIDQSAKDIAAALYAPNLRRLEKEASGLKGTVKSRVDNRLAQLHTRFGRDDQAAAVLAGILARDPDYLPAYLNLATLNLRSGSRTEALKRLRQAASVRPGDPRLVAYALSAGLSAELDLGPALADGPRDAVDTAPTATRAGTETGPAWAEE